MSIYKSQQIYGHTFLRVLRGLFGKRCDSYLDISGRGKYVVTCTKRMGHNSRHAGKDVEGTYCGTRGKVFTWGIGDNLV